MDTLTACPPDRTREVAGPPVRPCVAGNIGVERREIEAEPVADPGPAAPRPEPAPHPAPA
ncbi:hypothetical protein [Geodermatophilus ruber]|uniref:Uncharacterized protein n=1 Tax=Geodermatophilus ruber TaxID=504800 RepID=A0A1I4A9H0_9ACTN|nr:hypothetical protein [Geodermatophilus ruber]SFK52466.1 hypothetical protein SAMN04488085_102110 [Geodermatophilus ruber]